MNWARVLILLKALRPWLFLKAGHWFLWQSLLAGCLREQGRCQEGLWCLEQGVRTGARWRETIQGKVEVLKLQDVKVSYELLLLNLHCRYVCFLQFVMQSIFHFGGVGIHIVYRKQVSIYIYRCTLIFMWFDPVKISLPYLKFDQRRERLVPSSSNRDV